MFEIARFDVMVEFMKMDRKRLNRRFDWTQEFVLPIQVKMSLIDRILTRIGEALISLGSKLKQRAHTRLTAEQAQIPNFMIML